MATRPRRKKSKPTAKRGAKKPAGKTGAKAAGKKAARKKTTRAAGRKSAAESRVKKAPKPKSSATKSPKRSKSAKKSARRLLASPARRPKPAVARGPARGRVRVRPRVPKRAAALPRVPGLAIRAALGARYAEVLTPAALRFLVDLHHEFEAPRERLLAARAEQQKCYDAGDLPDFRADTKGIRDDEDWRVAPIPPDLQDRRIEITGPVDRKMIVNALNSGANVFMADFEDANAPTWANNIEGQINLRDRWAGKLDFTDPDNRKRYRLGEKPAVLIVRPRGWHLVEEHLTVDGEPVSGALFDFGLYFFHNATTQIAAGTGPYFYLPKLETAEEARLWNEVFVFAQERLGLPIGTIKATVLIETLPAAFQMEEILYELRDHVAGLNAGRWDYIFSFIKKLAKNKHYILPDRSQVVMGEAFLGAYAALLVKTCHSRGAFAMGGMAAQIPIKNDPAANEAAFAKVRADKEREVRDGCDGTWVAHPDLVPVAKEVFDRLMPEPNQIGRVRQHVRVLRDDLLKVHHGTKTEEGFRLNIRVGVQYIEAWLRGRGAVPIYNLMEDAATAEISRAQIWQWIKYETELEGGIVATPKFFERALEEEMERVKQEIGETDYAKGRFPEAIALFRDISLAPEFAEFLTIPAYRLIA
ncbi:MAG: malate synthase [Hyphomicrobiales bacterium]|jgi:malate synthase